MTENDIKKETTENPTTQITTEEQVQPQKPTSPEPKKLTPKIPLPKPTNPNTDESEEKIEPFKPGVTIQVLKKGDNKTFPKKGDNVVVDYVGVLHGGPNHNRIFDKNKSFKFQIGVGNVIKGWDYGLMKCSLGTKTLLKISWNFGYGESGYDKGDIIGPKQDLLFNILLKKINNKNMNDNNNNNNNKNNNNKQLSRKQRREMERKNKKNKNKNNNNNNNNKKSKIKENDYSYLLKDLKIRSDTVDDRMRELQQKNPELKSLMDKIMKLKNSGMDSHGHGHDHAHHCGDPNCLD